MSPEIADHYSVGGLRDQIEQALETLGDTPTVGLLAAVDEFHVGGRTATSHLVAQLALTPGQRVLDIGSGLGGTARYMATSAHVQVTGVDLTEEYVQVATWLSELVGLGEMTEFLHASAGDLPTPPEPFAAATLVHVGMNIADKSRVFREVADQIAIGGHFGIYDLMVTGQAQPNYPVPWASKSSSSFLERPADYVAHLDAAGFRDIQVGDRTAAALAAFDQLAANTPSGPAPLGLHLVMGPDTPTKFGNLVAAVRSGVIVPTEIVARR